jgi:hypothetical protein
MSLFHEGALDPFLPQKEGSPYYNIQSGFGELDRLGKFKIGNTQDCFQPILEKFFGKYGLKVRYLITVLVES